MTPDVHADPEAERTQAAEPDPAPGESETTEAEVVMNKERIDSFREDAWWWIENIKWWVKAKLTGRCWLCGLKGSHKTGCNGREWADPDGW